jgi:UDP-N-acetylmuramate--alanine ligase
MSRKILYLVNPISGTSKKDGIIHLIEKETNARKIAFEILSTSPIANYDVVKDKIEHEGFTMHNIENALAAIWVANQLGIDNYKIQAAIASFKGVKRRFEMIVNTDKHGLIDDYAHHPAELNALIEGVRTLFPNRKFVLVCQPHLFTRTRDFGNDFAAVLQKADQVKLLPIYPARELPIPGIDSAWLASKMPAEKTLLLNKEALLKWVNVNQPELIVTAGAGDIDQLVEPLKNILTH